MNQVSGMIILSSYSAVFFTLLAWRVVALSSKQMIMKGVQDANFRHHWKLQDSHFDSLLQTAKLSELDTKNRFEQLLSRKVEMEDIRVHWDTLLASALAENHLDVIVKVANHMIKSDVKLNRNTMATILTTICNGGRFDESIRILDKALASGMELTVAMFPPLLKNCGSASKAREIFRRMEFFNIRPNVLSFTLAIKSFEATGDWVGESPYHCTLVALMFIF